MSDSEDMDRNTISERIITGFHVVAMPFPGRGHINPMMNLCKFLVSKLGDTIKITFVVTEEWAGFIGSEPRPSQIQLRSIPNVIPSELVRGSNHSGFLESVFTMMEEPFEQLLDQLIIEATVVTAIIADTMLSSWAVSVGNRKNIPLVSLWIMSPSVFLFFYHFDLLTQKRHFLADNSAERGDELIDYLPGISPTRFADMPKLIGESRQYVTDQIIKAFTLVRNAQCLLIASFHELEAQATETLREILQFPVYTVGPTIPHFALLDESLTNANGDVNDKDYYFKWLDSQPKRSVLYVSFGSFLSFSREQMDEIVAGLRESGVRYLLVSRAHCTSGAHDYDGHDKVVSCGLVVEWCDQLRVLCHSSVGGFWTHCGWNSTQEALFAGVPMLTLPVGLDQFRNRKLIVDDWKVGMNVREEQFGAERLLVKREEITMIVKRFMGLNGDDDDDDEGKEMRRRASELKEMCRGALAKGGSSDTNLNAFIRDVLQGTHK